MKSNWKVTTFFPKVILVISWADHEPLKKGSYHYPIWADAVGWIMAMIAILSVPAVAIYQILYKVLVEHKNVESIKEVKVYIFLLMN